MGFFAALGATSCGHCPEHEHGTGNLPPKPPTAEEERKYFVTQIEGSGELAADLKPIVVGTADKLFEQTFGAPSPAMSRSAATACFRRGCLYQIVYRDQCTAAAFASRFYDGPERAPLRRWPGAIYRSAAFERKDGTVEATWALLINDLDRDRLLGAGKTPAPPPVVIPDRCGRRDAPPPASPSPAAPEVK